MNRTLRQTLAPIASLRLTVVLFVLAMFLIFAGTLAQVNQGIYEVTQQYFRSLFVWIPLRIFLPREIGTLPGWLPFPGGFLISGVLVINLVAAHIVRFKPGIKRIGMWLIHSGIILLILGEFGTGLLAYEGSMSIDEGSSSNFTENLHHVELAIIDTSDPDVDRVIVVSQARLRDAAMQQRPIIDERLPFELHVNQWMANSQLFGPNMAPPGLVPLADTGIGSRVLVRATAVISGVDAGQINAPSTVITPVHEGQSLGRHLFSLYLDQPQAVKVDGRTYQVVLRLERRYKPYTMHLIKFTHEKFTGTETPRNFSSLVRLVDPSQNEDREVLIWMNHPLRYAGETFYQASYKPDGSGTVLQVVDNPSWLVPYISCAVITLGMLIHFGIALTGFLRRSMK